jgi:hypothetical protein
MNGMVHGFIIIQFQIIKSLSISLLSKTYVRIHLFIHD